nr:probable inactive poly [ADP-ribose] polymerase SRO3 [Ipomoea batatas]
MRKKVGFNASRFYIFALRCYDVANKLANPNPFPIHSDSHSPQLRRPPLLPNPFPIAQRPPASEFRSPSTPQARTRQSPPPLTSLQLYPALPVENSPGSRPGAKIGVVLRVVDSGRIAITIPVSVSAKLVSVEPSFTPARRFYDLVQLLLQNYSNFKRSGEPARFMRWPNTRVLAEQKVGYQIVRNLFVPAMAAVGLGVMITTIHQRLRKGGSMERAEYDAFQKQSL